MIEPENPSNKEHPDLAAGSATFAPGANLLPSPVRPGTFSNVLTKSRRFRHAAQLVSEFSKSSFILTLDGKGGATLCRGWTYQSFNNGPDLQAEQHISEQMGYSGHWETNDGLARVDLTLDDDICPRILRTSGIEPSHRPTWQLQCLAAMPAGHPLFETAILACALVPGSMQFAEDEPHVAIGLTGQPHIVLGPGNGFDIKVQSSSNREEGPVSYAVDHRNLPVRQDEWSLP